MSILSSYPQLGSFMTLSSKRDALWNVVEPGDPYDIRKSMIAKVPGDKKNFMGDYLQIVCLFQAAQIERLCQFLDDFKLKYREVERRQLDRHSYEIQIKELNHKLSEETSFRQQNQKLKEFIKNINSNKQDQQDSVRFKYQRLLLQFKAIEDQNARLRSDIQNLNAQISTFDAKFEALRKSKQTQIQEIYSRVSQQSNMSSQFELNSLKSQYESEIQRIGLENQRLRQNQQENLKQLMIWQDKCRTLEQQIFANQPQDVLRHERQIAEYENRFVIFGKQIDRLNLVVRSITTKFQSSEQQNRDYQNKLQIANRELALLQNKSLSGVDQNQDLIRKISQLQMQNRRLQQSGVYLQESQAKLRFANEEIIRLNNQVKLQTENSNRLKSQLSKLQYEGSRVSILEKQLNESKQRASENDSLKMQLAQKQNKIVILRQQIERINGQIFKKGGLDSNYQTLLNEYQKIQNRAEELERRNQMIIQQYESRISQKVSEYQSRIDLINRTKGSEFQNRASLLQGQVQRLGELIQKRNQEIENLQGQVRQMKLGQSQTEFDINRKIQNYESVIQGMKRESDDMIKRIRELEGFQRKTSQYENKNTIISQQLERLNYQLKNKDMDIENLKIKLKDQEIAIIQKYQIDTNRKLGTYEINLNNLARENEQLKRKYAEMETKVALFSQEIDRLTTKLRQVQNVNSRYEQEVQQIQKSMRDTEVTLLSKYQTEMSQKQSTYQMTIRNLQGQTDQEIRRKLVQLQNSNRKNAEYERALDQVSREIQRLGTTLRQKNEESIQLDAKNKGLIRELQDLERKYAELQNMVKSKYQVEASAKITNLDQNLSALSRDNQELKRYLQEYESKLKEQNGAIEQMNLALRNLSQQNENLRRQIQETQFSYRNKLEVDVSNQYKLYEKTISDLKRDIENILRENNELKGALKNQAQKITLLTQEDEKRRRQVQGKFQESYQKVSQLESFNSQLKNENETLRRARDDIERAFRQYESQTGQKIAMLAQQHERILNHLQNKTEELKKSQEQVKQLIMKLQNFERSMNQSQSSVQQFEIQVNTRITQYEQNITRLTQQNADLQNRLKIINELNYKIAEYENKIVIMNQELERINANLRRQVQKSSQLENSLRNIIAQNNQLTKNIADLKNSISEKYQVQATRTIRGLQQNIEILQKENQQIKAVLTNYEQELNIRGSEIQKLSVNLNGMIEQNNHLKNQIKETEIYIKQRYESQASSRYSAYEKEIANYQKQIDDLMKKLIEYSERVVPQYEKQTVTLRQQIQKMNHRFNQDSNQLVSNLNALAQQNEALKKQIGQLQMLMQKYDSQTKQKTSSYEQSVVLLQRENEELKRYLQQFGGQYEGLGQSHKNLERQIQEYHMKVQSQSKKSEFLEKDLNNLGRENNELKQRLGEMQQQIERLIGKLNELSHQKERIKRQGRQNEAQLANRLQMEAAQQINFHKQQLAQTDNNLKASQREIQLLQKRLSQLGQDANRKIGSYDDELKRLSSEIQKRTITIQDYDSKLRSIFNENQQLKKHLHQTQINFNKTFQSEIKNRTMNYQQAIENINKNAQKREKEILQNSNQRIMELENKTVLLSQQLERLDHILKSKHEEGQIMHQQIQRLTNTLRLQIEQNKQLESEHQALRSHTHSEFTQLQTSYNLVIKENDNYKKNLLEYENSIKKLYTEFERLQKIINDYKVERQSLFQKNYGLSNEIQRLNAQVQRLQIEVEEVRLRFSDQAALNKRINEHMALFVVLFAEIESLRKRVKDKEKEVQNVRSSSLAPLKLQSRLH